MTTVSQNSPYIEAFCRGFVGGAASLLPRNARLCTQIAALSTGAIQQLGAVANAATGAAHTRIRETLATNPVGPIGEGIASNLQGNPSFSNICQTLEKHPEIVSGPIGNLLVAKLLETGMAKTQEQALNLIRLSSTTSGALSLCKVYLQVAEAWEKRTPEAVKHTANLAFQTVLYATTAYQVYRQFAKSSAFQRMTQVATVVGIGKLAQLAASKWKVDRLKTVRNLCLLSMLSRTTALSLVAKAAFAGSLVGGVVNAAVVGNDHAAQDKTTGFSKQK